MQLQVDTAPRPSPLMGGTATPGTIDAFAPDYSVPPVMWPTAQQGRPTLTGGIPGGRLPGEY
jgi:transcription initiation factor TFIID subunit 12